MSSEHILYIPLILFMGMAIGFVLGRQAASREASEAERRLQRRRERVERLKGDLAEQARSGDGSEKRPEVKSEPGG